MFEVDTTKTKFVINMSNGKLWYPQDDSPRFVPCSYKNITENIKELFNHHPNWIIELCQNTVNGYRIKNTLKKMLTILYSCGEAVLCELTGIEDARVLEEVSKAVCATHGELLIEDAHKYNSDMCLEMLVTSFLINDEVVSAVVEDDSNIHFYLSGFFNLGGSLIQEFISRFPNRYTTITITYDNNALISEPHGVYYLSVMGRAVNKMGIDAFLGSRIVHPPYRMPLDVFGAVDDNHDLSKFCSWQVKCLEDRFICL